MVSKCTEQDHLGSTYHKDIHLGNHLHLHTIQVMGVLNRPPMTREQIHQQYWNNYHARNIQPRPTGMPQHDVRHPMPGPMATPLMPGDQVPRPMMPGGQQVPMLPMSGDQAQRTMMPGTPVPGPSLPSDQISRSGMPGNAVQRPVMPEGQIPRPMMPRGPVPGHMIQTGHMQQPMMAGGPMPPSLMMDGQMSGPMVPSDQLPKPPMPGDQTQRPSMPGDQMPRLSMQGDQMPRPSMQGDQMQRPSMPGDQMPRPSMPGDQMQRPSMPGDQMQRPSMPGGDQLPRPSMPGDQMQRPSMPGDQMPRPSMPGGDQLLRPSVPGDQMQRPSMLGGQMPRLSMPGDHIPRPPMPADQMQRPLMPDSQMPKDQTSKSALPESQPKRPTMPADQIGRPMMPGNQPRVAGPSQHLQQDMPTSIHQMVETRNQQQHGYHASQMHHSNVPPNLNVQGSGEQDMSSQRVQPRAAPSHGHQAQYDGIPIFMKGRDPWNQQYQAGMSGNPQRQPRLPPGVASSPQRPSNSQQHMIDLNQHRMRTPQWSNRLEGSTLPPQGIQTDPHGSPVKSQSQVLSPRQSLPPHSQGVPQHSQSLPPYSQGVLRHPQSVPSQQSQGMLPHSQSMSPHSQAILPGSHSIPPHSQGVPPIPQSMPVNSQGVSQQSQSVPLSSPIVSSQSQSMLLNSQGVSPQSKSVPRNSQAGPVQPQGMMSPQTQGVQPNLHSMPTQKLNTISEYPNISSHSNSQPFMPMTSEHSAMPQIPAAGALSNQNFVNEKSTRDSAQAGQPLDKSNQEQLLGINKSGNSGSTKRSEVSSQVSVSAAVHSKEQQSKLVSPPLKSPSSINKTHDAFVNEFLQFSKDRDSKQASQPDTKKGSRRKSHDSSDKRKTSSNSAKVLKSSVPDLVPDTLSLNGPQHANETGNISNLHINGPITTQGSKSTVDIASSCPPLMGKSTVKPVASVFSDLHENSESPKEFLNLDNHPNAQNCQLVQPWINQKVPRHS
ncbi:mediator of DNA damage checkpoint protein 1-like [Ptychodera flava]|uniref:mediator of DNA damage checkpoint protein 1-like n=1 Tax=Ptychodera flava TaxID=63121 RepID=UPI003969F94D